MKCEIDNEKAGITNCQGKFCVPDAFDGARIAANFSVVELSECLDKVKKQLLEKPESCQLQAAYNEFNLALEKRMEGSNHA